MIEQLLVVVIVFALGVGAGLGLANWLEDRWE